MYKMSGEPKMTTLNLKDPLLTAMGEEMKDSSDIDRTKLASYTKEQMIKLPSFNVGNGLVALINGKKNCKDVEEMAKMSRIIVKIRNKMLTANGEWKVTKDELLDIENIFKSAPPAELNVQIHGQIYNKIQDLLREAV